MSYRARTCNSASRRYSVETAGLIWTEDTIEAPTYANRTHRRRRTAPHTASAALTTSAAHDTDIDTPKSPRSTCQPCTIRTRCAIATTAKMIAVIAMYDFAIAPSSNHRCTLDC